MRKLIYLAVLLFVTGCKLPDSSSSSSTTGKIPTPAGPQPDRSATLTWTAASGIIEGYKVEISGDGGTFFEIGILPSGSLGVKVTGLYANVKYFFRVRAFNSGGNGDFTANIAVTPK